MRHGVILCELRELDAGADDMTHEYAVLGYQGVAQTLQQFDPFVEQAVDLAHRPIGERNLLVHHRAYGGQELEKAFHRSG